MPKTRRTVDPNDLIDAGDTLEVIVRRGAGEEKYAATVRSNGTITVAFTDVDVKGLTEAESEARLNEKLAAVIRNPRVQVRIAQKGITRPKFFYILGEVKNPGKLPLDRNMTLLQAISAGGGHSEVADMRKVVTISRRGEVPVVRVANLQTVLVSGDLTADIPLEDNDIVFVPRSAIGDWSVYYNKALLPVLNSLLTATNIVFINKVMQDLFAQTTGPGVAVGTTCWVARVLYGEQAWQTNLLRWYIWGPFAEHWYGRLFGDLYMRYGREVADFLKRHPGAKMLVKPLFDRLLQEAVEAVGQKQASRLAPRASRS
ncbi:MAG: polysaccharide biosynthesis/export family protein [Nitrospirota bacterium]